MCPQTKAPISSAGELCKNAIQSVLIKNSSANWPFVMSHKALVNLPGERIYVLHQLTLHLVCLQKTADCAKPSAVKRPLPKAATSAASCDSLFSSPDSPLSPCFRVVSTIATSLSRPTPAMTAFINHAAITYGFCTLLTTLAETCYSSTRHD